MRRPYVAADPDHGDARASLGHQRYVDQAHEAFVLMILVMTVEQRTTRIIGDEIDFHGANRVMLMVSFITPIGELLAVAQRAAHGSMV